MQEGKEQLPTPRDSGRLPLDSPMMKLMGMLLAAFLAGIATYDGIVRIADRAVLTSSQVEDLRLVSTRSTPESPPQMSLTTEVSLSPSEESVMRELIRESGGIGGTVARYPFESNIRQLDMSLEEGNTSIAGLQTKGLVELTEEDGYDDIRERPTTYPAYRVTDEGWKLWIDRAIR